jgi:pyroglutamyl-peptidase
VTTLWPDADHTRVKTARIAAGGAGSRAFGPHTARLLQAARDAGVWAEASRDGGRYLCNYLCWRAIEATARKDGPQLAAFIHVPLVPRGTETRHPSAERFVSFEELVDAGEAMLTTMVKLTRQRLLAVAPG